MKKKRFLAVLCATLFCTSFFLASCHKEEGNMPPLDEVVTPPQEEPEVPPQEEPEVPPQEEPTTPPQEEPTTPPQEEPEVPPQEEPETPPQEEPETPPQEEPEIPPEEDDEKYKTLSLNYFNYLMIDTSHIMGYSIKKEKKVATGGRGTTSLNAVNGQDRDDIDDNDEGEYYFLYSTTETCQYGDVEYDEEEIKRVVFLKNTETQKDVYDDDGKIIDSDRRLSQEEIDAQVNKIYTTRNFTFIQFVVLVQQSGSYAYRTGEEEEYEQVTLRPEGLFYDKNGVADFDKCDYFSSNLTASFVIDNDTGFIYKIDDIYIKGFVNGLVFDKEGNYYKISVDEENTLRFTDVLPNKGAKISGIFWGNDGWAYVANDIIDEVDEENKIFYMTLRSNLDLRRDTEGNVYILENYENTEMPHIVQKMEDGKRVEYQNKGLISDLRWPYISDESNVRDEQDFVIGMYDNLTVYNFNLYTPTGRYAAYDIETDCGLSVDEDDATMFWLDDNYDTIILSQNGKLYFKRVDLSEYENKLEVLHIADFSPLSDASMYKAEDYTLQVGKDKYEIENVFFSARASGTCYYRLQKTVDGVELIELNSVEYSENIFIFQPINKRT